MPKTPPNVTVCRTVLLRCADWTFAVRSFLLAFLSRVRPWFRRAKWPSLCRTRAVFKRRIPAREGGLRPLQHAIGHRRSSSFYLMSCRSLLCLAGVCQSLSSSRIFQDQQPDVVAIREIVSASCCNEGSCIGLALIRSNAAQHMHCNLPKKIELQAIALKQICS